MTPRPLKIGLVARADNGGLGMQTYDFYVHMKPDKVMVVDISHLNGYTNYLERYPGAQVATGFEISSADIDSFLDGLDVVFTVECPYNHYLYEKARELGVKTVCQYNFEWLAHHQQPFLPLPDLFLSPSEWRREDMHWPTKYLHVPIDRAKFPFKKRTEAKRFLHIAGHRTFNDRNGTDILLDALPFIQNHDIEIIIRTQDDLRPIGDHRMKVIKQDVVDHADLYDGDVLILPRRYGGLSLQLNEAMSCGMVPIMPDASPQNEFLTPDLLIQPSSVDNVYIKTNIQVFNCSPEALAQKIDDLAGKDISGYSEESNRYAKVRDWKVMAPKYRKLFEELCSP